jgi:4-diphosphocytidyl-2-C-methyl-D-erythritol kinase
LILFPNSKINLGLRVISKRPDGYHNLETIFYPIPLKDAAEVVKASGNNRGGFELTITGLSVPGENSDNLCRKAWELLKNDLPDIAPVRMYLHKTIPIGAGLGGGSSDGAYTLLLLNEELGLGLSSERLKEYALKLGSDCPFFILNKPCLATGRGEHMKEINPGLDEYYFVLVDSGIHVSTGWAFQQVEIPAGKYALSLEDIIREPVETWKESLVNDFETPVFTAHPELKKIKNDLYNAGAAYSALTGTGSCVFGIFSNKITPDLQKLSSAYKVYTLKQNI